ncbi:hypothetical protein AQUCO_01400682v1 [Aquilegia coerulea]|uniref:Bifunctional inhibitor/plant lipid transfer protein/seed storage helical domain-containing protein n=1 Tax=Aquilegia coerulea TaxID=218851 RepID=A0A2G5DXM3_AQUCA|nr:hypothetical protein AQUCO_01400682v1 [Aquilegia coerulea]
MEAVKFLAKLLLIVGIITVLNNQEVLAQQCKGDVEGLIRECAQYVQRPGPKTRPSQGCCNIIKKVDVLCACKRITKEVEQIISMEKVFYVLKSCGGNMRRGTKCGSYRVPIA